MRLKQFFFFLALVLIVILAIVQFGQFSKFIEVLSKLNLFVLLLALLLRFFYYFSNTKYFQAYMRNYKKRLDFKLLFENVVTMNFVNTVFPTGGVSGIAAIRSLMRKQKVPANAAAVAQIFWLGFTGISFVILLMTSLLLLFLSQKIQQLSFRFILMALVILLVVSIMIVALTLNRKITEKILLGLAKPLNKLLKKFNRNSLDRKHLMDFIDRFYSALSDFKGNLRSLLRPFGWCFLTLLIDVASLYAVFVAFGSFPNPGVVIAAFTIAQLVSFATIFAFGVGAYELGMVATLVGLGLSFDLSFSASIVYRVIALWLFIPVGLYFYKKTMINEG